MINIVPAHQDDLPAIMRLEAAGFDQLEQWSENSWRGELLGEGSDVLIARTHQVVGVIALNTVADVADLQRIVVIPGSRRGGVGRSLLAAGIKAAGFRGAKSVLLEVRYDNEAAIALYQQNGFEQLAARKNYYGTGQHALVLKLYDVQAQLREVSSDD